MVYGFNGCVITFISRNCQLSIRKSSNLSTNSCFSIINISR